MFLLLVVFSCSHKNSWELRTIDLKKIKESDLSKNNLTAIVFLAPGCPLSEASILELNKLDLKYRSKNYHTYVVIAGKLFSQEEVKDFVKTFNIAFPVLIDSNAILMNKYSASITPEYFLLDKYLNVLYSGSIDDRAIDNDLIRQESKNNFAERAIDEYLQNKNITIPKTNAVGCYIEL